VEADIYLKWYDDAHPSAAPALAPKRRSKSCRAFDREGAMFADCRRLEARPPSSDSLCEACAITLVLSSPAIDQECGSEVMPAATEEGRRGLRIDETYCTGPPTSTDVDRIINVSATSSGPMKYRMGPGSGTAAVAPFLLRAPRPDIFSPTRSGARTGGINRAFGTLYKIRMVASAEGLETVSTAYYTMKWSLFYAAIALTRLLGPSDRANLVAALGL
jgi:beta-hydroxylase